MSKSLSRSSKSASIRHSHEERAEPGARANVRAGARPWLSLNVGQKMKLIAAVCGVAVLGGVACSSKTQALPVGEEISASVGSSYATAVVIHAKDQEAGIREEYAWLKAHFPYARAAEVEKAGEEEIVFGHHTDSHEGRFYSVHTLVLKGGSVRTVHFDITSYFGAGR